MRAVTQALLPEHVPGGEIVEVGCGAGVLTAQMARRYPNHIVLGAELRRHALAGVENMAASHGNLCFLQGNLHCLPLPAESAGLVVALDVLDQVGVHLAQALAEARRVLVPEGFLLVRVSAYDWLRGPHDRAFDTAHRFASRELAGAVSAAQFTMVRLTYANSLLLPPAVVVRLAQRNGWLSLRSELMLPDRVGRWLSAALRAESAWLRRRGLPVGLSLYALATKQAERFS